MKRKEIVETCRGVGVRCLFFDGKAMMKNDAGKSYEVDVPSLAAGISAGLAYAEGLLSGRLDADGIDYDTQAKDVVETVAMAVLKRKAGEL